MAWAHEAGFDIPLWPGECHTHCMPSCPQAQRWCARRRRGLHTHASPAYNACCMSIMLMHMRCPAYLCPHGIQAWLTCSFPIPTAAELIIQKRTLPETQVPLREATSEQGCQLFCRLQGGEADLSPYVNNDMAPPLLRHLAHCCGLAPAAVVVWAWQLRDRETYDAQHLTHCAEYPTVSIFQHRTLLPC